ncbi:hypothetical protein NPIL_620681, partial [Nephila pilipes]
EAYTVARQFNLIPPLVEQAEYHMFQREKVEIQLPELFHKIDHLHIVHSNSIASALHLIPRSCP